MAILWFFKMAAAAILDFRNFEFLTVETVKRVELHEHAKFRQNRSNSRQDITIFNDFLFFQDIGRPSSWICNGCVGITHEGHLVVFITVQKFVWNWCSSFDNTGMHVFRFREFGLKTSIHASKLEVLGFWPPTWGAMWKKSQKGTSLRESASFEPSCVKIRRRVWPVREFPRKGA